MCIAVKLRHKCFKGGREESVAKLQQHEDHVHCIFDWEGVVHHKYALLGQTINKEYYLNDLHWLRDAIQQNPPHLQATGDRQLHHDNAAAHTSCLTQIFLVKNQIIQVTQPPYNPDLAPCNSGFSPN